MKNKKVNSDKNKLIHDLVESIKEPITVNEQLKTKNLKQICPKCKSIDIKKNGDYSVDKYSYKSQK